MSSTLDRRQLRALDALRTLESGAGRARIDAALEIVVDTLGVSLAKVLEIEAPGGALRVLSGIGWLPGVVGSATVPATDRSSAGYALRHARAVIFNDIQGTSRFSDATLLREHDAKSGIVVRLARGESVIGVLSVHERSPRQFTADEATFMEQVAVIVAEFL